MRVPCTRRCGGTPRRRARARKAQSESAPFATCTSSTKLTPHLLGHEKRRVSSVRGVPAYASHAHLTLRIPEHGCVKLANSHTRSMFLSARPRDMITDSCLANRPLLPRSRSVAALSGDSDADGAGGRGALRTGEDARSEASVEASSSHGEHESGVGGAPVIDGAGGAAAAARAQRAPGTPPSHSAAKHQRQWRGAADLTVQQSCRPRLQQRDDLAFN